MFPFSLMDMMVIKKDKNKYDQILFWLLKHRKAYFYNYVLVVVFSFIYKQVIWKGTCWIKYKEAELLELSFL